MVNSTKKLMVKGAALAEFEALSKATGETPTVFITRMLAAERERQRIQGLAAALFGTTRVVAR